jgi:hypothetical protein
VLALGDRWWPPPDARIAPGARVLVLASGEALASAHTGAG